MSNTNSQSQVTTTNSLDPAVYNTLPTNANSLFTEGINCYDNLFSFLNHSGQCWSDSSSIFLLFSPRIGPLLQSIFNTHKTQDLANLYIDWCIANEEFIQRVATKYVSTPLTIPEFTKYIDYSSQYLKCLHQRYLHAVVPSNTNMKRLLTKSSVSARDPVNPKQIRLSDTNFRPICLKKDKQLSLCQEANGKYMTILLSRRKLPSMPNLPSSHTLLTQKYKGNNSKKTFLNSEELIGNDTRSFSLCIEIYLQFLNSFQRIRIHTPYLPISPSDLFFSYNKLQHYNPSSFLPFVKKISDSAQVDSIYSMICSFEPIHSTLSTILDRPNPFLDTSYYTTFFDPSLLLEDSSQPGHAALFLQCSPTQQFFYDNNKGYLSELIWKDLFLLHNDENLGIYYYLIYWTNDKIQSILHMLEENLVDSKPDASNLKGLLLDVLHNKPVFIGIDLLTRRVLFIHSKSTGIPNIRFKYPSSYVLFALFYILALTKSSIYSLVGIDTMFSSIPFTDPSIQSMYGGKRASKKKLRKSRKIKT